MRAPYHIADQVLEYLKNRRVRCDRLHVTPLWLMLSCLMLTISAEQAWSQAQNALIVKRALDPFLTHDRYRDADERVEVMNGRAEVWVLESLEHGDLDQKVCEGAKWIFGGRLKRSTGARDAFMKIPELREISLIFYKVKTKVNPNLEGRYVQVRSPVSTARFTLARERAMMIHSERALKMLNSPQCITQARELLDDLWVSAEVQKEREALSALLRAKQQAPTIDPAPAKAPSPR